MNFEKRHGTKHEIEDIILNNRREHYENILKDDNYNYDTWFDLIRLEEAEVVSYRNSGLSSTIISKGIQRCREVYERAIGNIPPINEKRYWKRYIYLWIGYAIFEELYGGDVQSSSELDDTYFGELSNDNNEENKTNVITTNGILYAQKIYQKCLSIIPHKSFTFGKIWLNAAHLEVRRKDLTSARKLLGKAIGENYILSLL